MLSVCSIGAIISSCGENSQRQDVNVASGEFVIRGQLPPHKYDSVCIYLVPMQGPEPKPVDSTFIDKDGKFEFRGNVEQVAVLRLTAYRRIGTQELLVVTEPGITNVVIDSISSSSGTPQNEALQRWKEHLEQTRSEYLDIYNIRRQHGAQSENYQEAYTAFRKKEGEYYYNMLKGLGRQTVSLFIHKKMSGELDSLRRKELNELLMDTTDYTKPQPGFHR